jgi:hypothetical protein
MSSLTVGREHSVHGATKSFAERFSSINTAKIAANESFEPMKRALYSALTLALLGTVASPVFAAGNQSNATGVFTVGGGYFDYDTTDGDDSAGAVISGAASLAIPLGPQWSAQFDVLAEQVTVDDDNDQYDSMQGVGGHITYRWPDTGTVGVFAGYGRGTPTDEETWSGGWIGLEGQLWLDNITLAAQAAWLDISDHNGGDNEGLDEDAYLVRGVARYFFASDVKAEVELAYAEASNVIDGVDDGNAFEWGVSVQARLADAPIYGTLAYRGGDYDATTETDDASVSMVTVSLSYLFGTDSLKQNDRNGASLDTPSTPLRAAGVFSELD